MLLTARWVLVMSHFEQALYADPSRRDLDDYWWELVQELQFVTRPDDRQAPDWAAKIHLTVAPVYYHNYLLGELVASQLAEALQRDVLDGQPSAGYVGQAQLGAFFRDSVFAPGASRHWQSLLERATGSRLSAEPFLRQFA
jgi:peptidyl-dipeptidase A